MRIKKIAFLALSVFVVGLLFLSWIRGNGFHRLEMPYDSLPAKQFPIRRVSPTSTRWIFSNSDNLTSTRCERWAVTESFLLSSESIRRLVKLEGWCLAVVANTSDVCTGGGYIYSHPLVVCVGPQNGSRGWGKSVGYLHAIAHGAKAIWDFDDRTLIKFWMPGAALDPSLHMDSAIIPGGTVEVLQPALEGYTLTTYNPYPALGAPEYLWPRGLPPAHVRALRKKPQQVKLEAVSKDSRSIAVLQSLSDLNPDLDALCRVTAPRRFSFSKTAERRPLVVPRFVMTPYNSQASLHFETGFWALLLPVTVPTHVADIWRSYISQRLFWDTDLHVAFMQRPIVVRDTSFETDDSIGTFEAERIFHDKTEKLVNFLHCWKGTAQTFVERVKELWTDLHTNGFLGWDDVEIIQVWLRTLRDIGYQFPVVHTSDSASTRCSSEKHGEKSFRPLARGNGHCNVTKSLTFWTSDLHDGTRIDMTSVLSSLGHKVIVAGHKGYSSPYPDVFKMPGVSVYTKLSEPIAHRLLTHTTPLDESTIMENFNFYKADSTLRATDAFFCSFPASMCELWMPFNKTIVYLPAHRYNLGRCTKESWTRLNDHLYMLAKMDNPNHVIAAESLYDAEYIRHYTGIPPLALYSYSGFYTRLPGSQFQPSHNEILVFNHWEDALSTCTSKFVLKNVRTLYPHYSLSDLTSHRAIVFFPYSVMSYKFTELYSLSIPLFVPSMLLMRKRRFVNADRTSVSGYYCNNQGLDAEMVAHHSSPHLYSPNVEASISAEDEAYWMQFSDFYVLPHVTYFDDFNDLGQKLEQADFKAVHLLMVKENAAREDELLQNWCYVSNLIDKNRLVPSDYIKAIKNLYHIDRLQVA